MQHVPAPGTQGVVAEQLVAGRAPDVGGHVEPLGQDFLRAQRLADDRPAAEDVRLVLLAFRAAA